MIHDDETREGGKIETWKISVPRAFSLYKHMCMIRQITSPTHIIPKVNMAQTLAGL